MAIVVISNCVWVIAICYRLIANNRQHKNCPLQKGRYLYIHIYICGMYTLAGRSMRLKD